MIIYFSRPQAINSFQLPHMTWLRRGVSHTDVDGQEIEEKQVKACWMGLRGAREGEPKGEADATWH